MTVYRHAELRLRSVAIGIQLKLLLRNRKRGARNFHGPATRIRLGQKLNQLGLRRYLALPLEHNDLEGVVEPVLLLVAVDGVGLGAGAAGVEGDDVPHVGEVHRACGVEFDLHVSRLQAAGGGSGAVRRNLTATRA